MDELKPQIKFVRFDDDGYALFKFDDDSDNVFYISKKKGPYHKDDFGILREDKVANRRYEELLEKERFLNFLIEAGVDNWDGYASVCELFDGFIGH